MPLEERGHCNQHKVLYLEEKEFRKSSEKNGEV